MAQEINQPKLIIGEGVDEERFLKALLNHLNICDVLVFNYKGKNNLSSYIKTLKITPGFSKLVSLAITRDADNEGIENVFKSITNILDRNGLPVPNAVGEIASGEPSVGIFIFPDGNNPGMLEDLCLASLESDPSMKCVDSFFKCIEENSSRQPNNMSKAKVHAWLASQEIPDKRLAEAAEADYWNWNSSAFDLLKKFLQSL